MKKNDIFDRNLRAFEKQMKERALLALADDIGKEDITTKAVITKPICAKAVIISKSSGILCGLLEAKEILKGLKIKSAKKEGDKIRKGEVILTLEGNAVKMLQNGRIALNYLQTLSGIATTTNELAKKYPRRICSLRKTHPYLSYSEKRAVKVGGGLTHRLGLSDGFLIKDNHIAAVYSELFKGNFSEEKKMAAVKEAITRAATYRKGKQLQHPIEIEVESEKEAVAAAKMKEKTGAPDAILIDNRKPKEVASITRAIRRINDSILIEASGGITPKNAKTYLHAGVDVISSSYLTLRAKPLDFSLVITGYK